MATVGETGEPVNERLPFDDPVQPGVFERVHRVRNERRHGFPPAIVFEDTQEISAEEAAIAAAELGLRGDPETTLASAAGSSAAREAAPAGPSAEELEAQATSLTL